MATSSPVMDRDTVPGSRALKLLTGRSVMPSLAWGLQAQRGGDEGAAGESEGEGKEGRQGGKLRK